MAGILEVLRQSLAAARQDPTRYGENRLDGGEGPARLFPAVEPERNVHAPDSLAEAEERRRLRAQRNFLLNTD